MRKLGIILLLIGVGLTVHFGYEHWQTMSSVTNFDGEVKKLKAKNHTDSAEANSEYKRGEDVATLVIPKLNKAFEVYWGTDENTLAKGVGMYVSDVTVPPGEDGHTVLSGHRDSVFRPLGELEDGDRFYVIYQGEDYEYKINDTWITDADDRSVIVEKDEPTLTMSTCYPFTYFGDAPDRYIIQANLVQKGDLL